MGKPTCLRCKVKKVGIFFFSKPPSESNVIKYLSQAEIKLKMLKASRGYGKETGLLQMELPNNKDSNSWKFFEV